MPFPTKIFSRSEFKWNNRFVYALTKHHRQRVRRIRIIISNCSPLIAIAIVSWLRRRCCWTKWTSSVSSRYFQSRTWFCFRVSAVVYSKVTLAVLTEGVTSSTHVFFFYVFQTHTTTNPHIQRLYALMSSSKHYPVRGLLTASVVCDLIMWNPRANMILIFYTHPIFSHDIINVFSIIYQSTQQQFVCVSFILFTIIFYMAITHSPTWFTHIFQHYPR